MLKNLFAYPAPLWRLWGIFTWFGAALATLFFSVPFLLSIIFGFKPSVQTIFIRGWCRFMLWVSGTKVIVVGEETLDSCSPFLLVTNHQSLMDIPVAFEAISGDIRMVAKKELFYIPVMGQCMRVGGFIPLLRGDKSSSSKVLNMVKKSFQKGIRVWVAPEGTRSVDGSVSRFKWGSFALAIEAQVPIQPIAVIDSYKVLSKTSWLPKVGQSINVHILDPVQTAGLKPEDKPDLTSRVEKQIREVVLSSI